MFEGFVKKTVRIQGMKDNEFILDKGEFKEKMIEKREILGNSDQTEWIYERKILKIKEFIFSSFRAYSVNWPFICFSGFGNYLVIINVF
jgi:hypothetical protein